MLQQEFEAARRDASAVSHSHVQRQQELRRVREELLETEVDTWRLGNARTRIAAEIERTTAKIDRLRNALARVTQADEQMERPMD